MNRRQETASPLHELVFGARQPEVALLHEGQLPSTWADDYCSALFEAQESDEDGWYWPQQMFQAVHFTSCHLGLRYGAWCQSTGKSNPETEVSLGRLQLESELFLWNSVRNVPLIINSPERQLYSQVDSHDVELVEFCLCHNSLLNSEGKTDHVDINAWKQRYRNILLEIGPKWRQKTDWWKWLALSIRFSSFYLDLALLPKDSKGEHENQDAIDPERITATIEVLRPHLAGSPAIVVIDHWLRISHLRRDSTGFPCVPGVSDPSTRPSLGIRTVSELFLQGVAL